MLVDSDDFQHTILVSIYNSNNPSWFSIMTMITSIVVTEAPFVPAVIEVKTSLLFTTSSNGPVVSRKLLMKVTASALYIVIVHHEVTELARLSTLYQSCSWAGTGLVALENVILTRSDLIDFDQKPSIESRLSR